jgi:hypothetical protein
MACYKDKCEIHQNSKDNGYYPKKPGQRQYHQIAATESGQHMKLNVKILGQLTKAIINSGITGNFMSPECKEKLRIPGQIKTEPIPITGLNRELFKEKLDQETGDLTIDINDHKEMINFNVMKLGKYKIMLGIPWLSKHNPEIN